MAVSCSQCIHSTVQCHAPFSLSIWERWLFEQHTNEASIVALSSRPLCLTPQWRRQRGAHGGTALSRQGPEPLKTAHAGRDDRRLRKSRSALVVHAHASRQLWHNSHPSQRRRRTAEPFHPPKPELALTFIRSRALQPQALAPTHLVAHRPLYRTARHYALLLPQTHDPCQLRTTCLNAAHSGAEEEAVDVATIAVAEAVEEEAHMAEMRRGSSRLRGRRKRTSWT